MKVILLTDVPKVGKKGEIKEVSDGYARNFLIARNLAVVASDGSKKILAKEKAEQAKLDDEKRTEALKLKDELANIVLEFKVKAKEGRVSGSISTKQIEEELKKQGFAIDKRKFKDNEPLNELGEHDLRIELYKDVIGLIKVRLMEE